MARPVTLFTGQWADLPLEELAEKVGRWGFDGLELACWGDHFEVDKAIADDRYVEERRALLDKYELKCWAISNHLVGQAVCDHPIDVRHQNILPAEVWGDGDPEGVRQRAAERMADTARAAAKFGVATVIGFTGRSPGLLVGVAPILFTTSIPSTTSPNTLCLLSSHGVAASVTKNWLPLVFGPELAIERMPGFECRSFGLNSSANL